MAFKLHCKCGKTIRVCGDPGAGTIQCPGCGAALEWPAPEENKPPSKPPVSRPVPEIASDERSPALQQPVRYRTWIAIATGFCLLGATCWGVASLTRSGEQAQGQTQPVEDSPEDAALTPPRVKVQSVTSHPDDSTPQESSPANSPITAEVVPAVVEEPPPLQQSTDPEQPDLSLPRESGSQPVETPTAPAGPTLASDSIKPTLAKAAEPPPLEEFKPVTAETTDANEADTEVAEEDAPVVVPLLTEAHPNEPSKKLPTRARAIFRSDMKNREESVRIKALLTFAREPGLDAAKLIFLLGAKDSDLSVREATYTALTRYRRHRETADYFHKRLLAIIKNDRIHNWAEVFELIQVVGIFDFEDTFKTIKGLTGSTNRKVAHAGVYSMMRAIDRRAAENDPRLVPLLKELIKSHWYKELFGFRRCLIDAAITLEQPEAVTFLVEIAGKLKKGKLLSDIATHIRHLSGEDFGPNPGRWQNWWRNNRENFDFAEAKKRLAQQPEEEGGLQYYDIPLDAGRIAFVLDTSRSMSSGKNGSRLDAAKRALSETISVLPEHVQFSVIVFNSNVSGWSKHLVPATKENREKAIAFVMRQKPEGQTASFDALRTAFDLDTQLEMIFFLSDGLPSDGAVVAQTHLVDAMRTKNRLRRLTLHTIGVFQGKEWPELERFMRLLAERNHGMYRRVD